MNQAEKAMSSSPLCSGQQLPIAPTMLNDILVSSKNNFGLLRLTAAAGVVISHAFLLATGDALAEPLSGVSRFNLGQHAVHVFFVLSGVMIAGSLDRSRSLVSFAVARGLRIVPGLAVNALFLAFLIGPAVSSLPLASYFGSVDPYVYPLRVLTLAKVSVPLPGVFEVNPFPVIINNSLWTLKYEVFCYVVLAILAFTGIWRSRRACLAVLASSLLVCAFISARQVDASGFTIIDSAARFWLCFGLGLALYRVREQVPVSWLVLAGIVELWWFGRGTQAEPLLSVLLAGYGAMVLAAIPTGRLRSWANRHDLSYGVYIYGWPTSQALVWSLPGTGPSGLAFLSLLLSGLFAWLSWRGIERPSLGAREPVERWLARRFETARSASAVRAP